MAINDAALTSEMLRGPVSRMLGLPVATVLDWTAAPLANGLGPTTLGIHRVSGAALVDEALTGGRGRQVPFALILKVLGERTPGISPSDHLYWKREVLAYSSGLLERLPEGIRAPRCYGVDERSETLAWLWLEDLDDRLDRPWSLADYERGARVFGRLNGSPAPAEFDPPPPWWLRDYARQWLNVMDWFLPYLEAAKADPVIGSLWSDDSVNAMLEIRQRAPRLLHILDELPLSLAHGDAHARNCVLPDAGSDHDAILIDWADLGLRPPGADLNMLLQIGSIGDGRSAGELAELAELIMPAYLEGLTDAGWRGDLGSVRRVFAASYALRSGCYPIETILSNAHQRARAEQVFGASFANLLKAFEQVRLYALQLIKDL